MVGWGNDVVEGDVGARGRGWRGWGVGVGVGGVVGGGGGDEGGGDDWNVGWFQAGGGIRDVTGAAVLGRVCTVGWGPGIGMVCNGEIGSASWRVSV